MNKVDFNFKEFYTVTAPTRKHEKFFIEQMEHNILNKENVYDLEYFRVLIDWQLERQSEDDIEFDDYLECEYMIKKLKWLRNKNIRLVYILKQEKLYEKLKAVLPEGSLDELDDLVTLFYTMESELYSIQY